jgi:hypothetical protein
VQVTRRERIRVKEAQRSGNPVKSRYDKVSVNAIIPKAGEIL